jgi:glycosyltransferase involved in cell wall biosynthesis
MKVSIITICFNAVEHIDETLRSVVMQDHRDIEHIVIDGGSTDGTQEKIERYREVIAHVVSEKDAGVYDAMNKGLALATGGIIAFVNAGDMIARRDVISSLVKEFAKDDADVIYGDALMVDPADITKVKRFWKGGAYSRNNFKKGWMPPHLATYIRRSAYDHFGHFREDLKVSADYELMFRFLYKQRLAARYVPRVLVRFRLGGV